MVDIKKGKKGQAAIEFLMTYGWMLLVVLIVGALIFSFVDFGSLLPNQIDLNNNLRGEPTQSYADSSSSGVVVTFVYTGGRDRVTIGAGYTEGVDAVEDDPDTPEDESSPAVPASSSGTIAASGNPSELCYMTWIKNADTDVSYDDEDDATTDESPLLKIPAGDTTSTSITFLNGQTAVAEFDCSEINGGSGLLQNDVLEGTITISKASATTGVPIPSTGPIRLTIS